MAEEQSLFPEYPTLARRSEEEIELYLAEIGDNSDEEQILSAAAAPAPAAAAAPMVMPPGLQLPPRGLFKPRLYRSTAHAFGHFVLPPGETADSLPIVDARNIEADQSLKGKPVKVTMDTLRVADYPGGGRHQVLVDFFAQHQTTSGDEPIHFTQKFAVLESQSAGTSGYPIFLGLNVGKEGISFKVFTVNVANDADEKALAFLDSDTFNSGLKLLQTANPAIAPLTGVAKGVMQMVLSRNRNVPVQDFYLGLDFSTVASRAKLKQGSYVVVQIDDTYSSNWRWDDWVFSRKNGTIVAAADGKFQIPYNYMVFSVSAYDAS